MTENEPSDDPTPGWPAPPSEPPVPGFIPPPSAYPPGGYQPPAQAYPPGGYQPPGSGYPPGGYGGYGGYSGYPVPQEHPQGTTILVLGIMSIVCCGVLGPVAWIMGNTALKEIDANPSAYNNRGSVQAGRIIGIVASVLLIIMVVGWVLLFALGSASSVSSY